MLSCSIVNTAVEWFAPYAKNLLLVGYGNHETSIIHHQETDILQRFASTLNYATGSAVEVGGYGGTIDIRVLHDAIRGVNFVVHYFHGSAGGGVWYTSYASSQSFNYVTSKDIKFKTTNIVSAWSKEFKQTRPLLQEEFANSAANNIKRMNAYTDLKRMLDETNIISPATSAIRRMVQLYENYKLQIDTVYNTRSEADINARDILRTATLAEMQDIAATNQNASGVYDILFSNFLRGD